MIRKNAERWQSFSSNLMYSRERIKQQDLDEAVSMDIRYCSPISYLLILWLFFLTSHSSAQTTVAPGNSIPCGDSQVQVLNSATSSYPYFSLVVLSVDNERTYPFHVRKDFLQVSCTTNSLDESVILVNHMCGGTGCSESSYSIIRTTDGENLLEQPERHTDGNREEASEILGRPIPAFTCIKQPGKSLAVCETEIYASSPIELG